MGKIALPFPIPREWGPSAAQAIEDNLQRMYAASGRLGAASSSAALANGLDVLVPAAGDMIVCTSVGLFAVLPLVTTAQRVLTNNGGTPTWALVNLTAGVTGVLPLANFFNATATQRLLGRNSAGTGVYEEVTFTQLLDWIGSAAQGDILYRGAASWARLPAGTLGQILATGGASANPSWSNPGTVVAARTSQHAELWATGTGVIAGVGCTVGSIVSGAATVARPSSAFADAFYLQAPTTTTATSASNVTSDTAGAGSFNFVWDFDLTAIIRTDPVAITGMRLWLGICAGPPGNIDALTTNSIMFRYSTVAGDGGFVGVAYDGTQAVTGTVATIAANTRYALRIRKVGSTAFFSVNGGAETALATHIPVADAYREFSFQVINTAGGVGTARTLLFSRMFIDYAS